MRMPIRTDWTLDETVMPEDMNDIGKELNRLKEEDKKLESKKLDKTGGTVTGTINATNLQVGGANVYTTSRKPTSSDVGASPVGHSHDDRYFTEAEMNEKLKTKVSVESGKGLSTNDYTTAEKNKLAGIAAGANAYIHPSSHPATMITEDSTHRFVTDAEKSNWNGKAPKDVATTSTNGLMAAADKVKLNGIANNANNYVHPDNSNTRHVTDSEKTKWNSKAAGDHNHFKCGIIDNKDLNDYDGEGLVGLTNNNCTNQPTGGYFYIFNIKYNNSSNNLKQIAYGYNQGKMYTRYRTSGTWSGWTRMYSSTDKPTPSEIGALGATAKAESAKVADAVAWANVTGRPSTFAPSSHTHTKAQITDMPTALKNPTAFKVQLNGGTTEGTNQFTYDGSAAKTINVTPANIGALPTSGGTITNTVAPQLTVKNSGGTDSAIVLDRNANANWKILNNSGIFKLQCDYTTSKDAYYDAMRLDYNTGAVWFKGCGFVGSGDNNTYHLPNNIKINVNWWGVNANSTRKITLPTGLYKSRVLPPVICSYVTSGDYNTYSTNARVAVLHWDLSSVTLANYDTSKHVRVILWTIGE